MSQPNDLARVEAALAVLGEHFDTVQIFTTRYEGSETGTTACQMGVGNWFARQGQIQTWLTKNDEDAREELRKDNL